MIRVISFFFEKSENGKKYDKGQIIKHFDEKLEDHHIKVGHAVRIEPEKKEGKPKRSKKEK